MEKPNHIECVVHIYNNDDNEIEVCTEDGEVLGIFSVTQVQYFIKPIKMKNGKVQVLFKRPNCDTKVYSVYGTKLKNMIKVNNEKSS